MKFLPDTILKEKKNDHDYNKEWSRLSDSYKSTFALITIKAQLTNNIDFHKQKVPEKFIRSIVESVGSIYKSGEFSHLPVTVLMIQVVNTYLEDM